MIVSRCSDCNHRDICKYKDEYDRVISDITVKVPEPFTLTMSCKYYYSTYTCLNTGTGDSAWDRNYATNLNANTYTL